MRAIARLIIDLIERRLWLFLVIGSASIAGLFYGCGVTWWTVLVALFTLFLIALFASLAWFGLRFFRALVSSPQADDHAQI